MSKIPARAGLSPDYCLDCSLVEGILSSYTPEVRRRACEAIQTIYSRSVACIFYVAPDISWLDTAAEDGFTVMFEAHSDRFEIHHIETSGTLTDATDSAFVLRRAGAIHAVKLSASGRPSALYEEFVRMAAVADANFNCFLKIHGDVELRSHSLEFKEKPSVVLAVAEDICHEIPRSEVSLIVCNQLLRDDVKLCIKSSIN